MLLEVCELFPMCCGAVKIGWPGRMLIVFVPDALALEKNRRLAPIARPLANVTSELGWFAWAGCAG